MRGYRHHCSLLALLCVCMPVAARADPVADFYRTTPMTLTIPTPVGDGYDAIGRLVARHLGDYIPGDPRIIVVNMGGASGRIAANYAYAQAPRDGSAIVEILTTIPLGQAMKDNGIRYDAARFNWIGSPIPSFDVFVVWRATGIRTMKDAQRISVSIGATSSTAQNYIYPKLANELLGARFKIVTGYPGGNEINLAMQRNEVQGRGAFPWNLLKATRAEWLRDDKLSLLGESSLEPLPDAPQVPRLIDLATTPEARRVFQLVSATAELGRPFAMPPGAPPERVAAVRKAFAAMVKDPSFIGDAAKMKEQVQPKTGEELTTLIKGIVGVNASTIERISSALSNSRTTGGER